MDRTITSLIIKVASIPSLSAPRWPIGRGTITLSNDAITLRYTSVAFLKKTRIIAFSDIDSYFCPTDCLVYVDHHAPGVPKIVSLGNYHINTDEKYEDFQAIISALENHQIPRRQQSHAASNKFIVGFGIIAALIIIGLIVSVILTS